MRKFLLFLVFVSCSELLAAQGENRNYTLEKIQRYQQEAKVPPVFIPLEIGEVTPEGWLLDWASNAANGITGHLDDYESVFRNGWKGFGFQAKDANEDGTGWPIEQCTYWLDGALKLGYMLNDTMLIRKTSRRLNLVVNGVLNGGETFIYWEPRSAVDDLFNNWAHGLMGRALVSYYQATHNPRILKALVKVYKKFPLKNKSKAFMRLNRGTTNLDAMTETYLMSGEKAILDSILSFSRESLFTNAVTAWNNLNLSDRNEGVHGVSFYEILKVPSLVYPWTGNRKDLDATLNMLKWGETGNLLPMGVCSSEEYLAGIGSIRNIETCNVPTSMWSFSWLLRLTGNGKWGDKIERVFFNAGPAPVARDFKTMCYYQSANRFGKEVPEAPPVPEKGDLTFTDHGCSVLCCVGNCNNIIPDYIGNMWMATMDNGLAATLYGPCRLRKNINGAALQIDCHTRYPFGNKIRMSVGLSSDVRMPLYFRIPRWCKQPSVAVNGKKMALNTKDEFVKIDRTWKNGDVISLDFPKTVQVSKGQENAYPQIHYFLKSQRAAASTKVANPFEYVTYGPLLFSLPLKDTDANNIAPDVKYGYALDLNPQKGNQDVKIINRPMPEKWSWQPDAPVQLKVKVREFPWKPAEMQPLPANPVIGGKQTTVTLIPYGCTKFRVTMFPVTKRAGD